jgi:transketolase
MRQAFVQKLLECAEKNDRVFLICGDLGYSVLEPFAERFPKRFLNAGVAEQNMTGMAAGLAKEGYNVFTYSIGNFPTLRCLEQIRYDVCYHELSVKIVAVGGGFAYGPLGTSHHTTEDLAIMRSLPHMTVTAPADPVETAAITDWLSTYNGPAYLRLNKGGDAIVHQEGTAVVPFKANYVCGTGDIAVLACGAIVSELKKQVVADATRYALYSVPFVTHIDRAWLVELAGQHSEIITVEEHQLNGGFGSAIVEALSDAFAIGLFRTMPRVTRKGIGNRFTAVAGTQQYLRHVNGLAL